MGILKKMYLNGCIVLIKIGRVIKYENNRRKGK